MENDDDINWQTLPDDREWFGRQLARIERERHRWWIVLAKNGEVVKIVKAMDCDQYYRQRHRHNMILADDELDAYKKFKEKNK